MVVIRNVFRLKFGKAREAVALTSSTSIGLAIVMAGLPWRPGDGWPAGPGTLGS